jgi:hypothetical protein
MRILLNSILIWGNRRFPMANGLDHREAISGRPDGPAGG